MFGFITYGSFLHSQGDLYILLFYYNSIHVYRFALYDWPIYHNIMQVCAVWMLSTQLIIDCSE